MTYFNNLGQARVGWRIPSGGVTPSTLWTSVYGVWNADTLGTSLDTSIYGVYNGDNVNDTSGNARNGTNVNNVTFTTGKVGNAFTFNGSNYVSLPNNSLNLTDSGSNAYSISLWVKFTDNSGLPQGLLTNLMQSGSNAWGWMIWYYNNQIYFTRRAGTNVSYDLVTPSSPAISANVDYNVVVTRKNGSTKIFINGILVASDTSTVDTVYTTTHYPLIGGRQTYATPVYEWYAKNGTKIDAVNVWTKELTSGEITSLYNDGAGAEYPFSTQTLPTYNDAVGTNHGTTPSSTLTGGVPGPSFTTGKIGKAFNFDGINDYVALPDNSLNFTGNFSYSFWIKSTNTSSFTAIISNIENARSPFGFSHGYWYRLNSGKIQASYSDGNNSTEFLTTSVGSVSNGSWNHVVITFNKTNSTTGVKIYINGNIDTTGIPPNTGGTALPIGYSSPMKACIGALYFNGAQSNFLPNGTSIDALSAWNKELTASEITELYNSGNGKQYPN